MRRLKLGPLQAGLILKGEQEFEKRDEAWPGDLGELNGQ